MQNDESEATQIIRSGAGDNSCLGASRETDEIQNRKRVQARPRTVGELLNHQRFLVEVLRIARLFS